MPNLKLNIIANYAGSIWTALMSLAFVPLYIRFMGMESYGLIGLFGTLITMFSVLDMGLSATLNREMARRSVLPGQEQASRDLLRTLEIVYWSVALMMGAVIVLLSYPIARYWVNSNKLSVGDVQQALMIMGLIVVMRWPFGLYQGGLMGLQKQVLVNVLNSFFATFRGLGAVMVLWLVAPTIQAFFSFQILASCLETFTSVFFLWRSMAVSNRRSSFKMALLREIRGYAAGMMGIGLAATALTQIDKIVLSKMLSLESFGYYVLAWTVGSSLLRLAYPIGTALFPRFTQLVSIRSNSAINTLYHRSSQLMSVVVLPFAAVIALYSHEILLLWIGIPKVANETALLASFLMFGTACNAMSNIPWVVALAYGWTALPFWTNTVSAIVLAPIMILSVKFYGLHGAGVGWLILNIGYVLMLVPIMHHRILKGELYTWYLYDVIIPGLAAVAPVILCKIFLEQPSSKIGTLLLLGFVACLSFFAAAIAAAEIRRGLVSLIGIASRRLFAKYGKVTG